MQPEYLPSIHNGNAPDDRATTALLASGGTDGGSAFVLRRWYREGDATEPVLSPRWQLSVAFGGQAAVVGAG